jgi:hypothetical protein
MMMAQLLLPNEVGEVSPSYGDGGVMVFRRRVMTPPSAARTPPYALRGEKRKTL